MKKNSFINKIIAKIPNCELDIIFDRFEEVSQPIYENIPHYKLQPIPKELPSNRMSCDYFSQELHFYVDGKEVSRGVYEDCEKLNKIGDEARSIALDEAMLQILREMGFISDSTEEKSAHSDLIPKEPNLIPEVIQFFKDNEEKMAHLDYIIKVLKDGPKSSHELQKTFSDYRKAYGPLVYSLLDELEYAAIISKGHESGKFTFRLTPYWETMYLAMKK